MTFRSARVSLGLAPPSLPVRQSRSPSAVLAHPSAFCIPSRAPHRIPIPAAPPATCGCRRRRPVDLDIRRPVAGARARARPPPRAALLAGGTRDVDGDGADASGNGEA
uniref:Uncharacterized protein n=1 Tax=Arundo donax TaxID=35708 RepID=A0A0A9AX51_ARUDO